MIIRKCFFLIFCFYYSAFFSQDIVPINTSFAEGMKREKYYVHRNDSVIREGEYKEYFDGKLITAGAYKNGVKDGTWKYYSTDNHLDYEVSYKSGVRDGGTKYYEKNRLIFEEEYSFGSKSGYSKTYFSDGVLKSETQYSDGLPVGVSRSYYHYNHQLKQEVKYEGSFKKHTEYYKSGRVQMISEYVGDTLYSVITLNDSSGKKLDIGTFMNGNGSLKHYYLCGKLESEVEYKAGKIDGITIYYNLNGSVYSKGYRKGHEYHGLWEFHNKIDEIEKVNVDSIAQQKKYALEFAPKTNDSLMSMSSLGPDYDETFVVVESMPKFPGDVSKMYEFISKEVKYPEFCKKSNISGKVYVQFEINSVGEILTCKILRSPHALLSAEAIYIVRSMPRWSPGMQNGRPVSVYFNLPISFKLK